MFDRIKSMFIDSKKKKENLFSLLLILVITLIIVNRIINTEEKEVESDFTNQVEGSYLAEKIDNTSIEKRLEAILDTIDGVNNVSVLITYSESSCIVPVYNTNLSSVKENEKETVNTEKEVILDSNSEVIVEKSLNPKMEGALITASGVGDALVKGNVISAVEAVTGLASHKIQVFEVGNE